MEDRENMEKIGESNLLQVVFPFMRFMCFMVKKTGKKRFTMEGMKNMEVEAVQGNGWFSLHALHALHGKKGG